MNGGIFPSKIILFSSISEALAVSARGGSGSTTLHCFFFPRLTPHNLRRPIVQPNYRQPWVIMRPGHGSGSGLRKTGLESDFAGKKIGSEFEHSFLVVRKKTNYLLNF